MNKYIFLFIVCIALLCLTTGCAGVLENSLMISNEGEEKAGFRINEGEDLLYTEDGYYVAEGKLCEMGKNGFFVEIGNEQKISFKLSPETIVYTGDNAKMAEGQAVKVVFDGEITGDNMENIKVIAITALEE